jgi:FixJ family two-component response regulator
MSCVIADVQIPVMCDVELLTTMRAQGYRVPFIFITACPDESVRARVLNAGAICFLEALRRTYVDRLPRRRLGRTAQRSRHLTCEPHQRPAENGVAVRIQPLMTINGVVRHAGAL